MNINKRQMKNAIKELRRKCFNKGARTPRQMMYPQYIVIDPETDAARSENFQTAPHITPYTQDVIVFNDAQEILDTIAYWKSEIS